MAQILNQRGIIYVTMNIVLALRSLKKSYKSQI